MSSDYVALEAVDKILVFKHGKDVAAEDGMVISGAIVIGLYIDPSGSSAASWHTALGGMHAFAQEGILRERLRELVYPDHPDEGDE